MRRQDSRSFLAEEPGQLPAGHIQVDSDRQLKGEVAKLSLRSALDLLLQALPSLTNFHLASPHCSGQNFGVVLHSSLSQVVSNSCPLTCGGDLDSDPAWPPSLPALCSKPLSPVAQIIPAY